MLQFSETFENLNILICFFTDFVLSLITLCWTAVWKHDTLSINFIVALRLVYQYVPFARTKNKNKTLAILPCDKDVLHIIGTVIEKKSQSNIAFMALLAAKVVD